MNEITITADMVYLMILIIGILAGIMLIRILYNVNKLVKSNSTSIGKTMDELANTLENANAITANLAQQEQEINMLLKNIEVITGDITAVSNTAKKVANEVNEFVESASDMATNVSKIMDLVASAQTKFGEKDE